MRRRAECYLPVTCGFAGLLHPPVWRIWVRIDFGVLSCHQLGQQITRPGTERQPAGTVSRADPAVFQIANRPIAGIPSGTQWPQPTRISRIWQRPTPGAMASASVNTPWRPRGVMRAS